MYTMPLVNIDGSSEGKVHVMVTGTKLVRQIIPIDKLISKDSSRSILPISYFYNQQLV